MGVLDEISNSVKAEQSNQENTEQSNQENTEQNNQEQHENINPDANQNLENEQGTTAEQQNQANNQPSEPDKKESIFANEELAEANAYLKKNPGKSFADYQALKAPTDSLNENDLIKSYLSEKEGKTEAAIAYELKRMELKESDYDFDDEFSEEETLENLKVKAEREELIQKAREWRDGFVKEQLNFSDDNKENTTENNQQPVKSIDEFLQDAKRAHEEYTQNYRTEVYKAVGEINEIPININGELVSFIPDEDFRTEMRKGAEDVGSIGKEFFDDKGNITNAQAFIKENTLWGNPKTRQKLLDFSNEQAVLKYIASRDKGQRNITLDDKQKHSVEGNDDSGKVVEQMLARNRNSF